MKKIFLSLMLALTMTFGMGGVALAAGPTDSAKNQVCEGISGQIGGTCGGADADVNSAVRVVLEILSWVAGIAAVIMIIVAGLKYITSGGDSSKVASAKSSLIYAIVGIIIVALAQFLVRFVIGNV